MLKDHKKKICKPHLTWMKIIEEDQLEDGRMLIII